MNKTFTLFISRRKLFVKTFCKIHDLETYLNNAENDVVVCVNYYRVNTNRNCKICH